MAFRRNDTGHSITQMQNGLLGWNPTSLPTFGADGDYGAETEAAVESYQLAAQLDQVADTVLGVCDGNTHGQLLEYVPDKVGGQGEKGEKGDKGDQGVLGPVGPDGPQGEPGKGLSAGDVIESIVVGEGVSFSKETTWPDGKRPF